MYVVTSIPLVSRTRATFRSAEFGFFGVCVKTRTHTPRFCGLFWSAGLLVLLTIFLRPTRTSWLMVGIIYKLRIVDFGLRIDCRLHDRAANDRDRSPNQSAIPNPQSTM